MCDDINSYVPSLLNPRCIRKNNNISFTQSSVKSKCSLSLKRNKNFKEANKENVNKNENIFSKVQKSQKTQVRVIENAINIQSIWQTEIDTLSTIDIKEKSSNLSLHDVPMFNCLDKNKSRNSTNSLLSLSSLSEHYNNGYKHKINYNDTNFCEIIKKPVVSVCFAIKDCSLVDLNSRGVNIRKLSIQHNENNCMNIDCEVTECSELSFESEFDQNMNQMPISHPLKRPAVTVNIEIKKRRLSQDLSQDSKILFLKTDAIEKISHVIVQPPNYKLFKQPILVKNKTRSPNKKFLFKPLVSNGLNSESGNRYKQQRIDSYVSKGAKNKNKIISLPQRDNVTKRNECKEDLTSYVSKDMSKKSEIVEGINFSARSSSNTNKNQNVSVSSSQRTSISPKGHDVDLSASVKPQVSLLRGRNRSAGSSPKHVETMQFNWPKVKGNKSIVKNRPIPHYKIVAGTHFAVDAFSYGDIPNVNYYFLTHFHSDHYSGLSKSFSNKIFCSKITADLCVLRLGVNPKCIQVMALDETMIIDGVEVTAIDANHCPGALMLVFTLPNGKTILHTGDFRATPEMESHPVFWNKDIQTIYLDTTYCNPRYDFPTQEHSLEMALHLLKQKKKDLEKDGKKFTSVLIVCGTYTIGKEKFFLGISRRVGCSVWACPEKDRILQVVEGCSFSQLPARSAQLHVVPMRELTYEKLNAYLESLEGAFSEVVAFKPSGWENGTNSTVVKDKVTIHGIPYSEHSSFSEMIRFVKFLSPKQVVPTVDISGGIKAVQKYFPCPLLNKEEVYNQSKVTDYFSIRSRQQVPAVT